MIVSDKKLRRYLYLGLIFKVSLSVIFFSDLESKDEVASSNNRIGAGLRKARAA